MPEGCYLSASGNNNDLTVSNFYLGSVVPTLTGIIDTSKLPGEISYLTRKNYPGPAVV